MGVALSRSIASVSSLPLSTTDACGKFCFWIPWFEIEWILRWREERLCFAELFTKPSISDLFAPRADTESRRIPATLVGRLRPGGDLAATLGARAGVVLTRHVAPAGSVTTCGRLAELLRVPAFTQRVAPPLPACPGANTRTPMPDALGRSTPTAIFGPFLRCIDIAVPEWYEIVEVPDVSICVTQALTGGVQTIYDGAFDIDWGTNPIPAGDAARLAASPWRRKCRAPRPRSNPTSSDFNIVGLLPVSAPYAAGWHVRRRHRDSPPGSTSRARSRRRREDAPATRSTSPMRRRARPPPPFTVSCTSTAG